MSAKVVYRGYGPPYRTIYNILYGECATGTNLPQQYRGQTAPDTMPFAFDKRLHYATAPSGNRLRHHCTFSRRLRDVTTGFRADQWKYCAPFGSALTNEMTGNRIQNNAQSAVLVVAVTGCCTEDLENASFVEEDRLRCGIRTRRGNFNNMLELSTISSWTHHRHLKMSLNGPFLRVFHAIVARNTAGHSALFLEHVPLRMFLGRRRRPYIVFRFRYSYGFMFVYMYIYGLLAASSVA